MGVITANVRPLFGKTCLIKLNSIARCLLLVAALAVPQLVVAANVADFSDFSLTSGSNILLPGRLYTPPEAVGSAARPFIVFLHGGGEGGTNNLSQVNVNIDNLLAEAKRRGAFLYAPQTTDAWIGSITTDRVMTMIDRAVAQQHVDDTRLYITGLSNGGGGTWNMLSRYAERFAAAVPICGISPAGDFMPSRLIDQSIFAFHARDDSVVSVSTSHNVINSILTAANKSLPTYPLTGAPLFLYSAPGLDLTYIEYPTGGHGIWTQAYNTPGMYNWLFAHTTAVPEPGVANTLMTILCFAASSRRSRRHPGASTWSPVHLIV